MCPLTDGRPGKKRLSALASSRLSMAMTASVHSFLWQ